jgi:phage terminase large subunit-like protein
MSVDPQKVAQEIAAAFHASAVFHIPDTDGDSSVGQPKNEFVDSNAIRWMSNHFYIPELKGPIVLDEYQKKALTEALAQDDGLFRYSTILWSDIKKSIKSTIAAAVTLWRAFQVDAETGWGSFYIIANDLKQADSRVFYYIKRAIELNPALREVCKIRTGSYKITLPKQTFIEAIPIDPTGEAGSNADGIFYSELWGAHGKAVMQMWAEMALSPTKFGKSFTWIESYAGYKSTSELLWSLYEQSVLNGEKLGDDLEMYADYRARLFALWNTVPRLPWQTTEYYDQERARLTVMPTEFDRVHRNQWSEGGTERYLPFIDLWDACQESLPAFTPNTPLILAADGAVSEDTFGLVGISRHPSRPGVIVARTVMAWNPHTASDEYIILNAANRRQLNFDKIEDDIKLLCKTLSVLMVAYDPKELHHMMTRLRVRSKMLDGSDFSGVPTVEVQQGKERLSADRQLLDLIFNKRIAHDGNELLRKHIDNADRKTDTDGNLRIVKRNDKLKIDLAVALSMACYKESILPVYSEPPALPGTTGYSIFGGSHA